MKDLKANENASYIIEQEKRTARKQSQQLRQRKQGRQGMWCAEA
jgi:hypothetical protein